MSQIISFYLMGKTTFSPFPVPCVCVSSRSSGTEQSSARFVLGIDLGTFQVSIPATEAPTAGLPLVQTRPLILVLMALEKEGAPGRQ